MSAANWAVRSQALRSAGQTDSSAPAMNQFVAHLELPAARHSLKPKLDRAGAGEERGGEKRSILPGGSFAL
jgi:hypothetical protein